MVTDEFTLAEAQAKRGQVVRSRPSIPWPAGVIGEIVEVGVPPWPGDHPPGPVVFTIAWQRFPEYGAVPHTAIALSKGQYAADFQEIWLSEGEQHQELFGV
jgi:hypothetical protein